MPLMDYVLNDPVSIPEYARPLHTEKIADLPCQISLAPIELPVSPLPMQSKGYVTFGVFNRIDKTSAPAIALWSRIFASVPDARLVVKIGMIDDPEVRASLLVRFVASGIAAERVTCSAGAGVMITCWPLRMSTFRSTRCRRMAARARGSRCIWAFPSLQSLAKAKAEGLRAPS
jgi:hypothetical protein